MALIQKNELINNSTLIEKKFLLIDSSKYENDAFEYLLNLVTISGAIAFITDTRKIWAQGQYFGGDVFSDKLVYWNIIRKISESGEELQRIEAFRADSALTLSGSKGLDVNVTEDEEHRGKIEFNLNTEDIVNTEKFTIEQGAVYNLVVDENKQIKMKKYVPCSVSVNTSLKEYDGAEGTVVYNVNMYGTDPIVELSVTANTENSEVQYDSENKTIIAKIYKNQDTEFTVIFTDGTTIGNYKFSQKWAPAVYYGAYHFTEDKLSIGIEDMSVFTNKFLANTISSKQITIEQDTEDYGWFICPADWNIVFTDVESGLQGGWEKYTLFYNYTNELKYRVWRTENIGLGKIKWNVTSK